MKFKLLKKMMIICMSLNLAVTMVPVSVYAGETEGVLNLELPEAESQNDTPGDIQAESAGKESETSKNTGKKDTEYQTEKHTEPSFIPVIPGEPETQAQTGHGTEAADPVVETEPPVKEEKPKADAVKRSSDSAEKVVLDGNIGEDYTKANGKYVILKNEDSTEKKLTMTLRGANISEIEVQENVKLTLVVLGTAESTIGVISGTGSVIVSESNGKVKIKTEIADTVKKLTVNSGTIFGSSPESEIKCGDIVLNGGSIACKVKAGTAIHNSGGAVLKRLELTGMEKDAFCKITDLKDGDEPIEDYESNGIWSDDNGKAVLYFENGKNLTFNLGAITFKEDISSITAEEQSYHYNGTPALKKLGDPKEIYKVKAGAVLTTVYGKKADSEEALTVTGDEAASIKIVSASMQPANERSRNKMILNPDTLGGSYRILQKSEDGKVMPTDGVPYECNVEMGFEDGFGFEHIAEGKAVLEIDKAELTPSIEIADPTKLESNKVTKVYDGTNEVPDGICELKVSGALSGDNVTGTATFIFKDVNAKKDGKEFTNEILVTDIVLDKDWGKYYTCTEKLSKKQLAKITQAPCPDKPKSIDPDTVELSYDTIKFKGIAGQEYAYATQSQASQMTDEKLNWGKSSSTSYCTVKNATARTGYTLYTRIAETDNYLASESVSTDVETLRAPNTVKESDVSVTGITDNGTYKLNTELTLTAKGANPSGKKPSTGDEKYVPYSWKLNKKTVWKKAPYTARITPKKAGTYTVVVTFRKYTYDGEKWVYDEEEDDDITKSVTFKANETGTSSGSSSGSTSTTKSSPTTIKSTTAAKTGDNTPLVPLLCVFVLSGAVVVFILRKKKEKK